MAGRTLRIATIAALPAALSDAVQARLMNEVAAGPEGTLYRCKPV